MDVDKVKTRAGICKITILVLGIFVLGFGLHSHHKSLWKNAKPIPVYKYCDLQDIKKCPSISMEQYFVTMIIICFVLSIISLLATFIFDATDRTIKLVDAGYHGVAAFLLLIAAIVYIVSANQIYDLTICAADNLSKPLKDECKKWLRSEKLTAGALTIIQTFLYGITAFLLTR